MSNRFPTFPAATDVFGDARPEHFVQAVKHFRNTARATLRDGTVVKPCLRTAVAAVRAYDSGFGDIPLVVDADCPAA
jgi:hypothetical protein